MTVYFVRHASAGLERQNRRLDERRNLDKRGVAQCHAIGSLLSVMKTRVDMIVSSPFQRALQTAAIIAVEIQHKPETVTSMALRPDAEYAEFAALLHRHRRKRALMVVGHELNLSGFLGTMLSGGATAASFRLKHAAVAVVEVTRNLAELQCYLTPDSARKILPGPKL